MSGLLTLAEQPVWRYFSELCDIPRPSKHEDRVIAWLITFADERGLEHEQDEVGNLIIRKAATAGRESAKGVILQSHVDMVPQKNNDTEHDFVHDPIKAYIDGEWVTAEGTTLGADNGIGVAAMLAVLDADDIQHGPIEALFTVDEEAGMTGALNLSSTIIKGELLFNLDTEDDGELYVGCAGGQDVTVSYPIQWEEKDEDSQAWQLTVKGLLGGHSGVDIDLGRGNANKLMNRILRKLLQSGIELTVANIEGGSLRNAIPRESVVDIFVPSVQQDTLLDVLADIVIEIKAEWDSSEPNLTILANPIKGGQRQLPMDVLLPFIRAIDGCPNGVDRMSSDVKGVVETSNNIAKIRTGDESIEVQCLVRSLSDTARDEYCEQVGASFWLAGAGVVFANPYSGWKPNPKSLLTEKLVDVHNKLFGYEPKIKVIHAGLECGVLGAIYPNWDMVSFGPTIRGAHSPDERVHIPAVDRFWDFLKSGLDAVSTEV